MAKKKNAAGKTKVVSLQIRISGPYLKAFDQFRANNPMDGRTRTSTFMAILRTLPEYAATLGK